MGTLTDLSDGAWYQPSGDREVEIMTGLLDLGAADMAVDLGAGDGRIVIAMAKKGAHAVGLEKDGRLAEIARANIYRSGFWDFAEIYNINFWDKDLSAFNKVALFQYHTVMERLERKLMRELSPGSLVVSHHWRFPAWRAEKQVGDIYLYRKY